MLTSQLLCSTYRRFNKTNLLHKVQKQPTIWRGMIQFLFNHANGRMVERGVTDTNTGIKYSHFS